ncbi:uncharacterized protein LOC127290895 [Leptopilina boulardi]|uniref:uncharacterized protein LOC127290895 n=1 Tax=Leptopilina boulardi TaxID=63433 RepID=UPI0021F623F9|nr:uncharacterized protein LOC127290895 [Leptopilina boulardi]
MTLDSGLCRDFTWRFVVAEVTKPIIRVDFLRHYNLLVDVKQQKLLDEITNLSVSGIKVIEEIASVKTVTRSTVYHELLSQFLCITRLEGIPQVKHNTVHHITTTPGPPVSHKQRRYAPDKLKAGKLLFGNMIKTEKARPSKASRSSPLHLHKASKFANDTRPLPGETHSGFFSRVIVAVVHRQLKAAIKCHSDSRWTEILPSVMLGV